MDQNTNTIKELNLIDESINAAQREMRIVLSEMDGSNSEKIIVNTNLQLNQVMDVISTRISNQADRLLIMHKTKELSDLLLIRTKQANQITEYLIVTLKEMADVKKVNDNLLLQIRDAKKEYLEFREKMISKYEALEKRQNESEGLNNG